MISFGTNQLHSSKSGSQPSSSVQKKGNQTILKKDNSSQKSRPIHAPFSNKLGLLFSTGLLAASSWMVLDSYHGRKEEVEREIAAEEEQKELAYEQYGWGHWSGNPAMDHLAHEWFRIKEFGPFQLREDENAGKVRVNDFFQYAIFPNGLPLLLTLASFYATLGPKRIHQGVKTIVKPLTNLTPSPRLRNGLKHLATAFTKGLMRGIWRIVSWPVSGGVERLGVCTGLLFFAAYFFKRFNDASGHQGQLEYFLPEIYGNEENSEALIG